MLIRKGNMGEKEIFVYIVKGSYDYYQKRKVKQKRKFQPWRASRTLSIHIGHKLLIILTPKFFFTPREAESSRAEEKREEEAAKFSPTQD